MHAVGLLVDDRAELAQRLQVKSMGRPPIAQPPSSGMKASPSATAVRPLEDRIRERPREVSIMSEREAIPDVRDPCAQRAAIPIEVDRSIWTPRADSAGPRQRRCHG